jgi:hypothetical protein
MHTISLSESALMLLRRYSGDICVDDSNRETCRELAAEGLLVAGHDFTRGRESFYRMTPRGVQYLEAIGSLPAEFFARRA